MQKNKDLLDWKICDPQNAQDILPMPYRLIDQVLSQTILYQLQLALFHIEQKKKNANYQGKIPQYIANTQIDIQQISTLSSISKYHNYLVAGDRKGQLLIIDIAKKSLYCKKQLAQGKRVNFITQKTIYDGQNYINIIALILNNTSNIYILRYKHNDPKLYLICEVQITKEDNSNINQYPFQCQIQDDGRLLIVKTYEGNIYGYVLNDIKLNQQKVKTQQTANQALANSSNVTKKTIIHPFEHSLIDKVQEKIINKKFQIKFEGYQKSLKYKDLITKLKNKSKAPQITQNTQQNNKKDSKKDSKKVQVVVTQVQKQKQKQIQFNEKKVKKQLNLVNGCDFTQPYSRPKFQPFIYVLYNDVEFPRKKSFEKAKNIKLASKIIYGWTNTKNFYSCNLLKTKPEFQNIPLYQQFLLSQQLITENLILQKQKRYLDSIQLGQITKYKQIYSITATNISLPQGNKIAFGQQDGTISIWNTRSMTLQFNTDKHQSPVTNLCFFQDWKVISGSEKGQVHIDNIIDEKNQVKRTNTFQAEELIPISDIVVNQIGLAYVLDTKGNLRVYDLWRNQKISRLNSCNNFAIAQNKGKKWISAKNITLSNTIYSNKDYSIFLSINWPLVPLSKASQTSKQVLDKVNELRNNPWKSKQINIHIVRNFQFLLEHFDGLQNVYKKGYQKGKLLNLFSNLQFSQLYDRNFDIPDFGKTVQNNIGSNKSQFTKTNISQNSKVSRQNSRTKKTIMLGTVSSKQNGVKNSKLTDQILHPQKFLFQRRKINKKQLPTNQKLLQTLRQQHKKKQRREILLQNDLTKTIGI